MGLLDLVFRTSIAGAAALGLVSMLGAPSPVAAQFDAIRAARTEVADARREHRCVRQASAAAAAARALERGLRTSAHDALAVRLTTARVALSACTGREIRVEVLLVGSAEPPATGAAARSSVRPMNGTVTVAGGEIVGGAGELDPTVVTATVRTRIGAIRSCYVMRLEQAPTLAGRIALEVEVSRAGDVTGVSVRENTTGDRAIEACVTPLVRRIRARPPPANGAVRVAFELTFTPSELPQPPPPPAPAVGLPPPSSRSERTQARGEPI